MTTIAQAERLGKSMDQAILAALNMPEEERRTRMRNLRKMVRKYDIQAWGDATETLFREAGRDTQAA